MFSQNCADTIKENLLQHPDIISAVVFLSLKKVVIEMKSIIAVSELQEIISPEKSYSIRYEIEPSSDFQYNAKPKFLQNFLMLLKKFFTKQNCCKSIVLVNIWFLIWSSGNYVSAQSDSSNVAKTDIRKIPAVTIRNFQGNNISTSTFTNGDKPMLIVFWYSVHRFPKKELDALKENYEEWKKEFGVKIIVISIDDSRSASEVMPMANAREWDFDFYLDINSDFKRAMNVNLVPHTFLIDGAGNVRWNKVGFMDGDETIIYQELKKVKT